jgi:hypothetical protein
MASTDFRIAAPIVVPRPVVSESMARKQLCPLGGGRDGHLREAREDDEPDAGARVL